MTIPNALLEEDKITAAFVPGSTVSGSAEHYARLQAFSRCGIRFCVEQQGSEWISTELALSGSCCEELLLGDTALLDVLLMQSRTLLLDLSIARDVTKISELLSKIRSNAHSASASGDWVFQISGQQANEKNITTLLADETTQVDISGLLKAGLTSSYSTLSRHSVFQAPLASVCPPLGQETTAVVSPGARLCLPAGAAPLVVLLDLSRFISMGRISHAELTAAVREALRFADDLFDSITWPLAELSWDAFLNRRIALVPVGIGNMVEKLSPEASISGIRRMLGELLGGLVRTARACSRELAGERGCFPGMMPRQVLIKVRGCAQYVPWQRRWLEATAAYQFRQRHLLFLCVAEFWPDSAPARPEIASLLPLLRLADGLGFGAKWGELPLSDGIRLEILQFVYALTQRRELAQRAL